MLYNIPNSFSHKLFFTITKLPLGGSNLLTRINATLKRPKKYQVNYVDVHEPTSLEDALTSPQAKEWRIAIQDEFNFHEKNQTWEIVDRMEGIRLLDTKWVLKVQLDSSGNIRRYKARLCARGFRQQYGIDYMETYAPVVKSESLRVLFAITAAEDLEMVQFDVTTAFLYRDLEEDIYIKVPEGLSVPDAENKACKLKKSL